MNYTGTVYRKFYPQKYINYAVGISMPINSSETRFYICSDSGQYQAFCLVSGSVLSPNNYLISAFESKKSLNFSGNLNNKTSDLYLNGIPLYLGLPITGNQIFTGIKIVNDYNYGADINYLNIYGNTTTNFSYTKSQKFPSNFVTGAISIVNSGDYSLDVFSGIVDNNLFSISGGFPLLTISPKSTGKLYLKNASNLSYENTNQKVGITLDTSIGQVNLSTLFLSVDGITNPSISISPSTDTIKSGITNKYLLSIENPNLSNMSISLKYASGYIGNIYLPKNLEKFYTESFTGTIVGAARFRLYLESKNLNDGSIPKYNVSEYNPEISAISYAPASGNLFTDMLYSPTGLTTGYFRLLASGITDIQPGATGIAMGKSNLVTGYSGYADFITGGILTGTYKIGTPLSNSFFGKILTGKSINNFIDYYTYSPNNKYTLATPLKNLTQYNETILTKNVSTYITGNFVTTVNCTGFAFITGAKSNPQNIFQTNVAFSIDFPYTIKDQSFSGKYYLPSKEIAIILPKDSGFICAMSDDNVKIGETVYTYKNQAVLAVCEDITFFPTGRMSLSADFTGFFYNPTNTGVFFNTGFTQYATGGGVLRNNAIKISKNVTGKVFSFNGDIIKDKYNYIYGAPVYSLIQTNKTVTGLMSVTTNSSVLSDKLIYCNATGTRTGNSSEDGFARISITGAKFNMNSLALPAYSIGDDGISIFNFGNINSFYKSSAIFTGRDTILKAARTTTGTFLASGYLTGQIYKYATYRDYTDIWNISVGDTDLSVKPLSVFDTGVYSGIYIPNTTRLKNQYIRIDYDSSYSSPYIQDAAYLLITGDNFTNGLSSGISILIKSI